MSGEAQEAVSGKSFVKTYGIGGITGGLIAGGAAVFAFASGLGKKAMGWLRWLLVPLSGLAGAVAGGYLNQDGPLFDKNGFRKSLDKKASIPEGYIAADSHAFVTAVNSATVAKTGHVHGTFKFPHPDELLSGKQELRGLDPFVEFDLNGDQRLEELKVNAKRYGDTYANPKSSQYIENVQAREKKIMQLIVHDIGKTYGKYCDTTVTYFFNKGEYQAALAPRRWIEGTKTTALKDMTPDSLVCRHYAPIACLLGEIAGVSSHLVISKVGYVKREEGSISLDNNQNLGYHVYMITDRGNAIVEATVAGESWEDQCYDPIINSVRVQDIIYKGKSAITDGLGFVYGGHSGDGEQFCRSVPHALKELASLNHGAARKAMQESIDEYNKTLERRTVYPLVPPPTPKIVYPQSQRQK